jgi:predicted nucleic acid-binding protein
MATLLRAREPSPQFLAVGRVLADSGPLLALFNAGDRWPVATEVCALLARRIGNPAALDFLRWAQRGAIRFDLPGVGSLAEVLAISERFRDLPFDLADASVAEAAARLRIRHVLTIDADFDNYRDKAGRALVNVLRQPG